MKFTCRKENLEKGLNQVCRVVPVKAAMPVLQNVHLLAKDGRLRISATNLDTSVIAFVGASIDEEGVITAPAKLFRDFVTNLPDDVITITLDNNFLNVKTVHNSTKINTIPASEYPEVPTISPDSESLELDSLEFSEAVKQVAFAAAPDDSRPVFSGVYLSFTDGVFNIAASDGFRLSERVLNLKNLDKPSFSAIVPAKVLLEVSRLLSAQEPTVICFDSHANLVMFKNEDLIFGTRIISGQFPDYKRIIPQDFSVEVEMLSSDLLSAVKLADIFAHQVDGSMKLKIDSAGKICVSASDPNLGEHTSSFEASVQGDTLEISINSKYLLDFLSNVGCEKICFRTQGRTSPCVFLPSEKEDFVHLIMPRQNS